MGSLFQKVNKHYNEKLPFVVYSKPNSDTIIGVFQNDAVLYSITDFTENGFAFVSFDGEKKYFIPADQSDVFVEKYEINEFYVLNNSDVVINESEKNDFIILVEKGIQAIKKNLFDKVVLSRKEDVQFLDLDIEMLISKLKSFYPNAFNYCFFHPKIGLWFGATPEQLLQVNNATIKTVALAGTQLYSESIIWEAKEKIEQEIVADFIVSGLRNFCHELSISEPFTFKAGTIAHIKTDVKAELNTKSDFGNLMMALHPTPAVCGLPKEITKQFILNNENYDRKFYTGFLGELNIDFTTFRKENSDLFVNLRCMEIENKIATIYVGCGITKDSIPEKEYIETVNKSMTIRKVLTL
jgi:isochorismate synthase